MKYLTCIIALLLVANITGTAQDNTFFSDENWAEYPLPLSQGILQTTAANGQQWEVNDTPEKISVAPYKAIAQAGDSTQHTFEQFQQTIKGYKGTRFTHKLDSGGYLIGYNGWSSGGSVWWFNETADSGYQVCAGVAVKAIIQLDGQIFVIDGHEKLDRNRGQMLYLGQNTQKKWYVTRTIRLSSAPLCYTVDNDRAYIVTDKDVIRFTADRGTKLFFKSPVYWGALSPNSIVIKNTDMYIGTQGGIFFISNFTGFEDSLNKEWEMRWFKPTLQIN